MDQLHNPKDEPWLVRWTKSGGVLAAVACVGAVVGGITGASFQVILRGGPTTGTGAGGGVDDFKVMVTVIFMALSLAVVAYSSVTTFFTVQHEQRRNRLYDDLKALWEKRLEVDVPRQFALEREKQANEFNRLAVSILDADSHRPVERRNLCLQLVAERFWHNMANNLRDAISHGDGNKQIEYWSWYIQGETALRRLMSSEDGDIHLGLAFFWSLLRLSSEALDSEHLCFVPEKELWDLIMLLREQGRMSLEDQEFALFLGQMMEPKRLFSASAGGCVRDNSTGPPAAM
jgi:hypothetical protein